MPRTPSATIAAGFPLAQLVGAGPLAMCDPDSHPAGRMAKLSLTRLGLWHSVEGKVARAENPLLAVKMVARGDAPYAIVFTTDALTDPSVLAAVNLSPAPAAAVPVPAMPSAPARRLTGPSMCWAAAATLALKNAAPSATALPRNPTSIIEVCWGARRMVTAPGVASICQGCALPPDGARIAAAVTMPDTPGSAGSEYCSGTE